MAIKLNATQQRVLGVLLEKSLSHPGAYPLTLNTIVLGCNQKNNRDPVVEYGEGEVAAAVHELSRWELVSQAPPEPSARANRFRHEAERKLGWGRRQQAVMAELFLRGPQTVGELRGRLPRMNVDFDLAGVQTLLDELCALETPFVVLLPRVPGQSTVRYAHTMSEEMPKGTNEAVTSPNRVRPESGDVVHRLERLEELVRVLQEQVELLNEKC